MVKNSNWLINIGDGLFKDLEPDIQRCANVRKEIVDAIYHRTDAE
jgi:hypothetical protein